MIHEATLIGHVGKKDIRQIKNDREMATIYLATNRRWKDSNGVKQEQTVWHNVNFFNKMVDIVKNYVHVGNLVYIKGDINHKQIPTGERAGQWTYSVTAKEIRFLKENKKSFSNEIDSIKSNEEEKPIQLNIHNEDYFYDDDLPF